MQNFKLLSIIIVNFKSQHLLEKCVASVYQNLNNQNFEIIVVNNDEEHVLSEVKKKFPSLKILQQSANIGYGRAANQGARLAKGELFLILNPDTELLSNLNAISEIFSDDLEVGALSPKLVDEHGKTQAWIAGEEISLLSLIRNNLGLSKKKKAWESVNKKEVGWVSGAALFIRKEVFELAGGFDEKIFMYFEDVDLCKRLRNLGKKIIYLPDARIIHHGGKSFSEEKRKKNLYYASQEYYLRKHFGKSKAWILKILRLIFA